MNSTVILTLYGLTSFLLGYLLNRYLIGGASQNNSPQKANTSGIRWGKQSKPLFGGMVFFSLFLFGVINYSALFYKSITINEKEIGIVFIAAIAFLIGMADDFMGTSPTSKSLAQLVCALLLINFGVYIQIFETQALNYVLTIFWVIGIMNSINMLDNMDAITSSNTFLIFIAFVLLLFFSDKPSKIFYIFAALSIIAGCGSFLIFNWHPSKMYMGDSGSMFLGVLLSIFGILFVWNREIPTSPSYSIITPAIAIWLIFTVPITDTIVVSTNRMLRGQSPFVGGRDHTTHFLSYLGCKDSQVALVLIGITTISILLAMLLIFGIKTPTLEQLCCFAAWPAAILTTMFIITRKVKPTNA